MIALAGLCVSAALLITMRVYWLGALCWLVSLYATLTDPEPSFRKRLGVLLGTVAILAVAPIHTDTSTGHFIALAIPFFLVIFLPAVVLGKTDPGVIRYRLWPRKFRWLDIFYVAISIPLSWAVFEFYFKVANPDVPTHWILPIEPEGEVSWRLFFGINFVGLWDEFFFVNTVFAVLRSVFPFRVANAGQAVIYTAVLTRMAFTGIGPIVIYIFALTQGSMFEESENLLYVLLVHLIVDFFLLAAIFNHYYPGYSPFPI